MLTPQVPSHDLLLLFDRTRCRGPAECATDTRLGRAAVSAGWLSCSFQSYSPVLLKNTLNYWGKTKRIKVFSFWLLSSVQKRFEVWVPTRVKQSYSLSTLVSGCGIFTRWHPLNNAMLRAEIFAICFYLEHTSTPHLHPTIPLLPQITPRPRFTCSERPFCPKIHQNNNYSLKIIRTPERHSIRSDPASSPDWSANKRASTAVLPQPQLPPTPADKKQK